MAELMVAGVARMRAGPVTTVKVTGLDALLVLPTASTAVAAMVCEPPTRVLGQLHWPVLLALAVQTSVTPSRTVTTALASAVPVMMGLMATVVPSPGAVMTGGVETVSLRVEPVPVAVPSKLVCEAVMLTAGASGNALALTVAEYAPAVQAVVVLTVPTVMVTVPAKVEQVPETG